jgi:hypothetical protein
MDNKSASDLNRELDTAIKDGSWLILVGHGIGQVASPYVTAIGALETLLQRLSASRGEIWVDTLEAVGLYLKTRRSPDAAARSTEGNPC